MTQPPRIRNHHAPRTTVFSVTMLLLAASAAHADTGVSPHAPEVTFYLGLGEDCCGEDPHPVHGIATADGGYAIVGKVIDNGGNWDGFLVKVMGEGRSGTSFLEADAFSQGEWSHTMGSAGKQDGINNVASTASALFAAGFIESGDGTVNRYLVKYDSATGTKLWETSFPDSMAGRDGAFESIMPTIDGGLIATGLTNAERGALEGFKSYGNAWDGQGFVSYFSASQLEASTAPDAPAWITLLPDTVSGKGIREVTDSQGGFVIAAGPREEESPRAIRLGPSGDIIWNLPIPSHGEVTDIAVLGSNGDVDGFAMVGHKGDEAGGIDGSITMLSPEGAIMWQTNVGNPAGGVGAFSGLGAGNPKLIFDECWGIAGTADGGAIVACGTGIEGCAEWSPGSEIRTECDADPRRTWRGLVVKLDGAGNELWHRLDSFVEPGEVGEDVSDSASEYVSIAADGSILSTVDQGFGIGILVFAAEGESTSNPSSTTDDTENTSTPDTSDETDSESSSGDATSPETNTEPDDALSDISREDGGCAATTPNSTGLSGSLVLCLLLMMLGRRSRKMA
ncbi:MAG: hypothetical protein VX834_09125 [Myxococcota bacterium]|nr:hypothetical protein [Myxococcota bacterium]